MAVKIAKLENQYKESVSTDGEEAKKGLFTGVAIFVNGYTGLYCVSAPQLFVKICRNLKECHKLY